MKRCKIDWQFHFASYDPKIHGTAKAYCQSHGLNYNSWRVTKSRMKKEALAREAARVLEAAEAVCEVSTPISAADDSALAPEQPAEQEAVKEAVKANTSESAPVSSRISGRPLKTRVLSEADLLFLIMDAMNGDLPEIPVKGRSPGTKGPRKRKGPVGAGTTWIGPDEFFNMNRNASGFVEVLADV